MPLLSRKLLYRYTYSYLHKISHAPLSIACRMNEISVKDALKNRQRRNPTSTPMVGSVVIRTCHRRRWTGRAAGSLKYQTNHRHRLPRNKQAAALACTASLTRYRPDAAGTTVTDIARIVSVTTIGHCCAAAGS